jgi:hypothetical protein
LISDYFAFYLLYVQSSGIKIKEGDEKKIRPLWEYRNYWRYVDVEITYEQEEPKQTPKVKFTGKRKLSYTRTKGKRKCKREDKRE